MDNKMRGNLDTKVKYIEDIRIVTLVLFFSRTSIVDFLSIFNIDKSFMAVVVSVTTYFCLFLSIILYKKTIKLDGIFLLIFTTYFFYWTLEAHPEYWNVYFSEEFDIYKTVFNGFSFVFAYYFIRIINEERKIIKIFNLVAYIGFFGTFWQVFNKSGNDYGMRFGYTLSLSATYFLYYYFIKDNKKYLIYSIISIAFSLIGGSRGPLLGYLLFYVVYKISSVSNEIKYKNVFKALLTIIFAILISSKSFLKYIFNLLKYVGFESRSLLMFIEGRTLDNNGRSAIYYKLSEQINNMSFFELRGAYADRYIMNGRFYAHNILLESTLTFGIFFTGILVIFILFRTIKVFFRYKNDEIYGLLLVFMCFSLSRLFISSSFWYEPIFGAYLGLLTTLSKGELIDEC